MSQTFLSIDGKILTVNGEVILPEVNLQEKSVTPTKTTQIIQPDDGYTGLSMVTIGAAEGTVDIDLEGVNEGEALKPQSPLQKGDDFFYPLTTTDQVIMEDGSRLNATLENLSGEVMIGASESSEGASGLVPAPSAGNSERYLCADGTWKEVLSNAFYAGTSTPTNTKLLWIDTTATTGGLKYYNGSAWVSVPVAFS